MLAQNISLNKNRFRDHNPSSCGMCSAPALIERRHPVHAVSLGEGGGKGHGEVNPYLWKCFMDFDP
jgi:hypothetical protein